MNQPRRGKKRLTHLSAWQSAADAIVQQYRLSGLLHIDYQVTTTKRHSRRYRDRPARIVKHSSIHLQVTVDEAALPHQLQLLGWRVYVTNQPLQELSLIDAVNAYRQEYLIESGFGRFKGCPLSLTPMYLQRDDHITGLIRLLSIGLRVLTLLEFSVRRNLVAGEKLAGLYPANPKRLTSRPTAEQLLAAFRELTLTIAVADQTFVHLTPLSPLQQRILSLLNFPVAIYTQLIAVAQPP